jgi:hypothetical protein
LGHAATAAKLAAIADRLAELKPYRRGDRFYVERHKLVTAVRAIALEVAELEPERRRRSFQAGMIAVHSPSKDGRSSDRTRIIPVHVRRSRRVNAWFPSAF